MVAGFITLVFAPWLIMGLATFWALMLAPTVYFYE